MRVHAQTVAANSQAMVSCVPLMKDCSIDFWNNCSTNKMHMETNALQLVPAGFTEDYYSSLMNVDKNIQSSVY